MVTEKMIEAAQKAVNTRHGLTDEEMRKALEAALSADAEPVDRPKFTKNADGSFTVTGGVFENNAELSSFIDAGLKNEDFEPRAAAPVPSVAVKALEPFANPKNWIKVHHRPEVPGPYMTVWAFTENGYYTECEPWPAIADALTAQVQDVAESPALKAIIAERHRQIEKEGWTPAHDDKYKNGELLEAAACYALHNGMDVDDAPGAWPWPKDWWKPTSRQRDLEKAGALIAAELDRVIRAAAPAAKLEEKP